MPSDLPAKYRPDLQPAPLRRTRRQRVLALCSKEWRTTAGLYERLGGNYGSFVALLSSLHHNGELSRQGDEGNRIYRRRDETS